MSSDYVIIIFQFVVLIFSVVIHEVSHGYMAERLGDPTARLSGRLTLNPLKHLDPIGSVMLPLFLVLSHLPVFGWAVPVPYNPHNLRDPVRGAGKIAAVGPASNLMLAIFF
ncbi:MAG TPA: site-2 protease family protein, partial [Candidatus Paceibacterota bacterium]|nr:site-2 protease family protein [Candidatus Paceibacterota bacterium]